MKKTTIAILLASLLGSGAAFAHREHDIKEHHQAQERHWHHKGPHYNTEIHWGYTGDEGPKHWGELSPEYASCASGKNQSPINLTNMIEGDLPELYSDYTRNVGDNTVLNNGHTIQVSYPSGNGMMVGDRIFELKQFHFHSPSENTINGEHFPMEAHFVHADAKGNLAVIAVMFKVGEHNDELEKIWMQMPKNAGESEQLYQTVNAGLLLPQDNNYYRFNGSLTTPPCSEGVNWFVMKNYLTASEAQIREFTETMHHHNNRPVQAINAREVIQ